jgi:tRNA(fMet)-specific endonuclease VapC
MMTFAELRRWTIEYRWGAAKLAIFESALEHYLVLGLDKGAADKWAEVTVHRRRIGRPIDCGDCWIAATALRYDLPLVTHNGKHYADIPGLRVVSHAG